MNQTRGFLFILFVVFSFLLMQAYNEDNTPKSAVEQNSSQLVQSDTNNYGKTVTISNGLLNLTVDVATGDFVNATLDKYSRTVTDNTPLALLSNNSENFLQIVNGLYGAQGTDSNQERANYSVVNDKEPGVLVLSYTKNGITYTKRISLVENSYEVKVNYFVENKSSATATLAPYSIFRTKEISVSSLFSRQNIYGTNASYAGLVVSTDADEYEKVSFGDIQDGDLAKETTTSTGWLAISQHFFVTAYVPSATDPFSFTASYDNSDGIYRIATTSKLLTVASGEDKTFEVKYWIGPKDQNALDQVAPKLSLVVDYGWAWFLSLPLFKLLNFLHSFIPNWGLTIIALTIVVRLIILPLSRIQFRNQALMLAIRPELAAANERAGEDRMRRLTETQKVFRKYGASQFTGCFPALIQMPIFLALFYLINEAVELRHQPFFGWITDLSQSDPYFVLPILNGLTMVYMFSLTPQPEGMDPTQAKVMKLMPYFFMIIFLFLPSGLILYYIISNLITIGLIIYYKRKITYLYDNNLLPTFKETASKTKVRNKK